MKFIDLYAGVGGVRLGLEKANQENPIRETSTRPLLRFSGDSTSGSTGNTRERFPPTKSKFECVWSCEIDRWCQAVYRYRFGETPAGDVRQVDPRKIPDFDVLCAGFPCQSFSLAGKRGGFEDARGTLFYEICRIARVKRPQMLLLENVKGLLSADDRLAFRVVLESLGKLGYDAEWQVLNSKDFGVPQNRERVFIVGHLGGLRGREVFPIGEGDGVDSETQETPQGNGSRIRSGDIAPTLDSLYWKGGGRTYIAEEKPMIVADRTRTYANLGRNLESPKSYSNALSGVGKDNLLFKNRRIRRLTPRECERLQGFPDDFTKYGINEKGEKVEISDTQRYRMMGNAVTVSVVEFIARRIK